MKTADNFLKITIERLFRVNGTSAQQTGVIPDVFIQDFSEIQSEREKSLPYSLSNISIDPNKYYHPYPAISMEPLKIFSRAFSDTSRLFISFNKYLDFLSKAQAPGDQLLVFSKMQEQRRLVNRNLADGERMYKHANPPYEIEWNQYERMRMKADDDLRKSNMLLTQVLTRDTGILLAYQLAFRIPTK